MQPLLKMILAVITVSGLFAGLMGCSSAPTSAPLTVPAPETAPAIIPSSEPNMVVPPVTPEPKPLPVIAQGPEVDKLAPDFQLKNTEDQDISLRDLQGKAVMLNFWATWCSPCRIEMPFMQEIFENKQWSDKNLQLLTVNVGESPSRVVSFMKANGFSFPVSLDTGRDVSRVYNVRGIPTTFFIDKNGIIRDVKIGAFLSSAEIEQRLMKVIH